jgi:hypothetical protein
MLASFLPAVQEHRPIICSNVNAVQRKVVLVLVLTNGLIVEEQRRRSMIRSTWIGRDFEKLTFDIRFKFVACQHSFLDAEADVVQLKCTEGYKSLSTKVMTMFAWAVGALDDGEVRFDFLAKTDADVFLNTRALSTELERIRPGKGFWWGFVHKDMLANRDISDKNSDLVYPLPGYPPYTTGVFYMMEVTCVRRMARLFESGRMMMLRNEDQTVGVAMRRLGYEPVHSTKFQQWRVCADDMIALHPVNLSEFEMIYNLTSLGLSMCTAVPERNMCPLCYDKSLCMNKLAGYRWWDQWTCDRSGATVLIDKLGSRGISRHFDLLRRTISEKRLRDLRKGKSRQLVLDLFSHNNSTRDLSTTGGGGCSNGDDLSTFKDRFFVFVWTTPGTTFGLKHHRAIESVLYHHPEARVRVFSNTLDCSMFSWLRRDGFDVRITKFDLSKLAETLPGKKWLSKMSIWQQGPSFYAHLSDFVRLAVLYRFGGVYMDTDMILVNRIPAHVKNGIALEYCDNAKHDFCMFLPEFGSSWSSVKRQNLFYTPNSMMIFEPRHEAVLLSLEGFDGLYNPAFWPCGTMYLSRAVKRLRAAGGLKPYEILDKDAFFPISWQDRIVMSQPLDALLWSKIRTTSIAVHLWNKLSGPVMPSRPSLMYRLFENFALYPLEIV